MGDMIVEELAQEHEILAENDLAVSEETPLSLEVKAFKVMKHLKKECKPCGFSCCRNEDTCPYCHICDNTESKRRKKEGARMKKQAAKDADPHGRDAHFKAALQRRLKQAAWAQSGDVTAFDAVKK